MFEAIKNPPDWGWGPWSCFWWVPLMTISLSFKFHKNSSCLSWVMRGQYAVLSWGGLRAWAQIGGGQGGQDPPTFFPGGVQVCLDPPTFSGLWQLCITFEPFDGFSNFKKVNDSEFCQEFNDSISNGPPPTFFKRLAPMVEGLRLSGRRLDLGISQG